MLVSEIITKHYDKLKRLSVHNPDKVISFSLTQEDILHRVFVMAINKFGNKTITEEEGLSYIKKTLYNENHFQWCRKKNDLLIYSESMPERGYYETFDN